MTDKNADKMVEKVNLISSFINASNKQTNSMPVSPAASRNDYYRPNTNRTTTNRTTNRKANVTNFKPNIVIVDAPILGTPKVPKTKPIELKYFPYLKNRTKKIGITEIESELAILPEGYHEQ
jgi:hypothetical protein